MTESSSVRVLTGVDWSFSRTSFRIIVGVLFATIQYYIVHGTVYNVVPIFLLGKVQQVQLAPPFHIPKMHRYTCNYVT